jgi:hypothetical protein
VQDITVEEQAVPAILPVVLKVVVEEAAARLTYGLEVQRFLI